MNYKYRGRNHTKKQKCNCKPALSIEEKKKRKQHKQFIKTFPTWKHLLPCYSMRMFNAGKPNSPLIIDHSPS